MSLTVEKLKERFQLEVLAGASGLTNPVRDMDIKRPGIEFAGYWEYFTPERIQVLGRTEVMFLREMNFADRSERLAKFFSYQLPAVILTRDFDPPEPLTELAEKAQTPILRTGEATTRFFSQLSEFLERELAPVQVVHGVLVEVYGVGVLLTGDSGIGKSETALELVKRGHRLVADDMVEFRRIGTDDLIGRALKINQHYMEVRGLGIIDVKTLFGAGAVKIEQELHLIAEMVFWSRREEDSFDRLGLVTEAEKLLDLKVAKVSIPVRPGRNLATIIEVAAMNHRLKYMGVNAAQEFVKTLEAEIARKSARPTNDGR